MYPNFHQNQWDTKSNFGLLSFESEKFFFKCPIISTPVFKKMVSNTGAASCHYHLLNQESNKLFSKAILCSGVVNRIWSMQTAADQKKILQKLLKSLGCPANSTPGEILEFLQSVDISLISQQLPNFALRDAPRPAEGFCQDPNSLVPLEEKPVLVGALTEEGNNLVDLFFPGAERKSGMTW